MSFIEGIGDEVLQFFGLVFLVFLGAIAWWSTSIRDLPQIRTVLIVERRSQTVTNQQTNLSQHPDRFDTGQRDEGLCEENTLTVGGNGDNKSEMPSTNVHLNQTEGAGCNSNNETKPDAKSSKATVKETKTDIPHVDTDANQEQNQPNCNHDNIRIRLKYLNDDQKLVEGRLQELLGDFKRRHFSMELAAQKFVRLIFNGQVLQRDDQTLQGCGLYDNCVVHCLVHAQQNANRANSQQHSNTSPPDWNLGGLLYACLSLILALAWICRYNYSHLFTLTTTTALVGLTGMFAVSVIGQYMPDQEQASST